MQENVLIVNSLKSLRLIRKPIVSNDASQYSNVSFHKRTMHICCWDIFHIYQATYLLVDEKSFYVCPPFFEFHIFSLGGLMCM